MTCAQCREQVLEAEQIEDEEECLLRDQHLAVHPTTIQPETRRVLQHFVITRAVAAAKRCAISRTAIRCTCTGR